MKRKTGDKVRVRKDLKEGERYGGALFTLSMSIFRGREVKISETYEDTETYGLDIDFYLESWTEEMFE